MKKKTYKVLFADDEYWTREKMRSMIPWETYNSKPAVPHADQAAGYIFLSLFAGCGENEGGRGLSGWRA